MADDHIKGRRLWAYARTYWELTIEEQEHLASCSECLEFFKLCVASDTLEEATKKKKSRARGAGAE